MQPITHIRQKMKIARAVLITTLVAILAFPVTMRVDGISEHYRILINGEEIGIAASREKAEEAYHTARLTLNSQSDTLTLLRTEVTYEPVRSLTAEVMSQTELAQAIYDNLTGCLIWDKSLAYTLRLNDYTVTLASRDDVLSVLEQVQGVYDTENEFVINLCSEDKQAHAMTTDVDNLSKTANNPDMLAVGEDGQPVVADGSVDVGQDGLLSVDFVEDIEVIATYATDEQISDVQTAYENITKAHANNEIYSVQAGDCLSAIADQYNMSTDQLLSINPEMTIDSNLLVGDQIVVMVPKPELSVVVSEQVTYTEDYEAEVVYQDNPDKYVGDNTVLQEPATGNRTVTAIVHYDNGVETGRDIIKQQINTEAVAKVVERGTKALPTYIYPTTYGRLSSGFGMRWGYLHKGLDFAIPVGSAARASRAGTVEAAGWMGGYGYCVIVNHGDGVRTRYAHLSSIECSVGQYVDQGQVIARTGNTGDSTGPHIHFEIIVNGTAVNPANYLP